MATTFYLHATTSGLPSGTLPSAEQSTLTALSNFEGSQTTNRLMNTTIGTGQTSLANSSTPQTSLSNYYVSRWVSPLLYQTSISANTWLYNFATQQSNSQANFPCNGSNQPVYIHVYVWRPSNGTKVGTVIDGDTASTVIEGNATHHVEFTGSQVTGLTSGDAVLVVEVWFQITQAMSSSYTQTFYYDGTTENRAESQSFTNHASFIETPENLVLTPQSTKLYFHSTASAVSGTLPSTEQSTLTSDKNADAQTVNRTMNTTKGTSQTSISLSSNPTTNPQNYYFTKFVSPLLSQTSIAAGTWNYSLATSTGSTNAEYPCASGSQPIYINCYVWKPSNGTKVGTILDGNSNSDFLKPSSVFVERSNYGSFSGSAVSGITSGDAVIVFEVWFQITQASSSPYTDVWYYDGNVETLSDDVSVTNHAALLEVPEVLSFTNVYNRSPSTDTVTISESSLTRIKSATRTPSSDSTTVSESSLTAVKFTLYERVPSTDNVSASDTSLTRILSAVRVPSPESPTISEASLTRMLSAYRIPSSDSITVNENTIVSSATKVRNPSTDNVSISDASLTRMLSSIRVPSSDSITVSELSLTRIVSNIRIPSTDIINIGENVDAVKTVGGLIYERAPTAEDITIVDASLTRMLSALRVPSTEDVIVADSSLTRMLSASRSPISDSVTTNDNATQSISKTRIPSAENVTILDSSLTRILSAIRLPSTENITVTDSSLTRILSAIRTPTPDIVTTGENIDTTVSGRISRSVSDTVTIAEQSLTRMLSLIRTPTQDTQNIFEQVNAYRTLPRLTATDSITVSDATLTRIISLSRSVASDTVSVIESSLDRMLTAFRSPSGDIVSIGESVSRAKILTKSIEDTVTITEPVLERLISLVRLVTDSVNATEELFSQSWHRFVFDSVTIAEQLFNQKEALGGAMAYATPAEVRPLLGNLGDQRTDDEINLAIDAAYDEINRRTNRNPPDDWKETDLDFGIIKKLARYIAVKEMAIGIKDFDTSEITAEIDRMYETLGYGATGETADIVETSEPETYAANEGGLIWSTRYSNLRKNSTSNEGDNTFN